MPDGYSQIFISYVFGPSGFWTMAPPRYRQNMIPSFPWIAPPALHPGAIPGKEGIKFCHLATLERKDKTRSEARVACFPAALYPKRNKVKASEDDDEGTINIIAAATFPIKPQRSLYFTPVKMSEATSERTHDGRIWFLQMCYTCKV